MNKYIKRPNDIYLEQQNKEEDPIEKKLLGLTIKHSSSNNPDTTIQPGVQPDWFPNTPLNPFDEELSDWQKQNLDKIQQEKYLASRQSGLELAGNMFAGVFVKGAGYLFQGGGAIADLVTPDDEEANQLFDKRNPLYEAGKAINDWNDNFFPQYARRPELAERGEVDWNDWATYTKLATEVGAQVLPSVIPGMAGSTAARLAFGGGIKMAEYIPKLNTALETAQASGQLLGLEQKVSTLGALFSMASVNAKRTQIDKEDELKQKYYSDKSYYEKLYGSSDPDLIDYEIKKAGDLVFYTTLGLNLATGMPLAKLIGTPVSNTLNTLREGIIKASTIEGIKKQVFAPMLGEALEEGGETILEKSADELMKIRGAKIKAMKSDDPFTESDEVTLEEYLGAVKNSFIKNATSDETLLSMIGGLFGGGFEVLGTMGGQALKGGDESFLSLAKNKKAMKEFIEKKLDEDSPLSDLLNKHIRNIGTLMYQNDPEVISKRDSFTNVASSMGTAMHVSLENKGFDVFKEQGNAILEALDRNIREVSNGTAKSPVEIEELLKKDPNNEQALKQQDDLSILKSIYEDKAFNEKLAKLDEKDKRKVLLETLQEQRDNLSSFLDNSNKLRDNWVSLRESGVTNNTLRHYLNLEAKSLLLNRLINNPEVVEFRKREDEWVEGIKQGVYDPDIPQPKTEGAKNKVNLLADLDETIKKHQEDTKAFSLQIQKEQEAHRKGYTTYLSKLDPRGWFGKKQRSTTSESTENSDIEESSEPISEGKEQSKTTSKTKAQEPIKSTKQSDSVPNKDEVVQTQGDDSTIDYEDDGHTHRLKDGAVLSRKPHGIGTIRRRALAAGRRALRIRQLQ